MNTKKAKEFLKGLGFTRFTDHSPTIMNKYSDGKVFKKDVESIIELLRQGKKDKKELKRVWQMVKEIKYEINWHRPEREVYDIGSENDDEYINETLDLINNIEQKYFARKGKGDLI